MLPGGPKYRGGGSRELWESSKVRLLFVGAASLRWKVFTSLNKDIHSLALGLLEQSIMYPLGFLLVRSLGRMEAQYSSLPALAVWSHPDGRYTQATVMSHTSKIITRPAESKCKLSICSSLFTRQAVPYSVGELFEIIL